MTGDREALAELRSYIGDPGNWSALDGRRAHLLRLLDRLTPAPSTVTGVQHVETETEGGPNYCPACSSYHQEWVKWEDCEYETRHEHPPVAASEWLEDSPDLIVERPEPDAETVERLATDAVLDVLQDVCPDGEDHGDGSCACPAEAWRDLIVNTVVSATIAALTQGRES